MYTYIIYSRLMEFDWCHVSNRTFFSVVLYNITKHRL